MTDTPPPIGSMYLYDDITPPLLDNSYQLSVVTNVTFDGSGQSLPQNTGYFNIEGPRFSLAATEVAGVFPPRNGHGGFDEVIPQIVIKRRTLPWERALTSNPSLIGTPKRGPGDPPPPNPIAETQPTAFGPAPWVALLLFEEGEYKLSQNVPLQQAVPADVYLRLEAAAGITCDTVEVRSDLLAGVLPSLEELTLLAHVRQVNVDDRELNAGSSNGWFSVVMSNRLPSPGKKYRACLVSLEERTDLVKADPPPVARPIMGGLGTSLARPVNLAEVRLGPAPSSPAVAASENVSGSFVIKDVGERHLSTSIGIVEAPVFGHWLTTQQVVLLHSWTFECEGIGTFRDYMQRLNVSMIGTVEDPGHPSVTDTSHIQIALQDRVGAPEQVWYRGPLVPFPLTRDPLTYHSADQCRRATPETGAEDISYAAAFEVGRLVAAADERLAQELMRWRRESFRQSARTDSLNAISTAIALPMTLDIHRPVVPVVSLAAAQGFVTGIDRTADRYGLGALGTAVGLNAAAVKQAWNLGSVNEAAALIGADAAATGAKVNPVAQTARPNVTIEAVAADTASLQALSAARDRILANTQRQLEDKP
jgi:hypothetical protein